MTFGWMGSIAAPAVRLAGFLLFLATPLLCATDFSVYRGFRIGADVATIAKQAGVKPADASLIHEQPAVIQEIEFRPSSLAVTDPPTQDPVSGIALRFFKGTLHRIVVTYDRYRVAGMTTEDMIDAISVTYGVARKPEAEIAFHSNYAEIAKVLARWGDEEYACDLVQTGDRSSFALVLYSTKQDALAQSAILEALRLDALSAPKRALDKEQKRIDDERSALEKVRAVNKPRFHP